MSETKVFKIKKTVPGEVLFIVHPMSNMSISRTIRLTDRQPVQVLPLDWALSIFVDVGNYNLYKEGYITFEDNQAAIQAAYENNAYFDDKLDFVPVKTNNEEIILAVLKTGNRASIDKAIAEHGVNAVKQVAIAHTDELTHGVIVMLESIFHVQLVVDGEDGSEIN